MMWRCPKLHRYWVKILDIINVTFGITLELEARVCLLGCIEERMGQRDILEAAIRCLFQARKLIALKWQAQNPPTVEEWFNVMNSTIGKERGTWIRRGNLKKFKAIWEHWLGKVGRSL